MPGVTIEVCGTCKGEGWVPGTEHYGAVEKLGCPDCLCSGHTPPTCTRRALLDIDEDEPTGPMCGRLATHRVCDPAGWPVCADHQCRCHLPLY